MSKAEINFLERGDSRYPALLSEIRGAPSGLYFLGKLPAYDIPRVAIVGTRKATEAGKNMAKRLAEDLSRRGLVVVSGLAMGIDTAAHQGSLRGGSPTIAVLGNGLDSIYPEQNENLANQILQAGGAIISEYSPGTPVLPHRFLERNRIVSGLSLAAIIIEAPRESGALVTARLAAEQGREVFVFPGPVEHPNYKGSHALIRDGARLVASAEDIMEDLNLATKYEKVRIYENTKSQKIKDEKQLMVLRVIEGAGEPVRIDKIIELTKLEPQVVSQTVAMLVINNFIKESERGYTI
ncbi:DNA-protecting protein DprA [Candidatus Wolfebacteria bacterium]|nr:DNA-protecting protein DprA [Candidatus Wolfebacteria bacterium]